MDMDLKCFSQQIDLEKERQTGMRKQVKKVKKTLQAEVDSLNFEIQGYEEKKERVHAERLEMEDAIEQLKDNQDDLNEQILRVDLKIS
jgi:predicted  nucleic acid-binding Zn-ribbon protein